MAEIDPDVAFFNSLGCLKIVVPGTAQGRTRIDDPAWEKLSFEQKRCAAWTPDGRPKTDRRA